MTEPLTEDEVDDAVHKAEALTTAIVGLFSGVPTATAVHSLVMALAFIADTSAAVGRQELLDIFCEAVNEELDAHHDEQSTAH